MAAKATVRSISISSVKLHLRAITEHAQDFLKKYSFALCLEPHNIARDLSVSQEIHPASVYSVFSLVTNVSRWFGRAVISDQSGDFSGDQIDKLLHTVMSGSCLFFALSGSRICTADVMV